MARKDSGQGFTPIEKREQGRWVQSVMAPDTSEIIGHVVLDSDLENVLIHGFYYFLCAESARYRYLELNCLALQVSGVGWRQ